MIITLDGPTASGKSTAARLLAHRLGFFYLSSGLLYRALAYILLRDYEYTLATIADPAIDTVKQILDPKRYKYLYDVEHNERIFFDEVNITCQLQDDRIGQGASIVSTNQQVRISIDEMQRTLAKDHNIVIDGRDAGSVVFPHAAHKFFLTASEAVRAQRWYERQKKQGDDVTIDEAYRFIRMRDARDTQRAHAPLIIPAGAHVIDSSHLSLDATQNTINAVLGF